MKRIQLFVSIVLLSLASLASAQVRQTTLYIDDGTGIFTQLKTATGGAGWTLTLPNSDGAPSQFLQTDGSGNATWASVAGSFILFDNNLAQTLTNGNDLFTLTSANAGGPNPGAFITSTGNAGGNDATGLTISATGSIFSRTTGLRVSATGTGSNYAILVPAASGFVGIGNTSPTALLSVGAASALQVDASGNLTTTGTITGSSLTSNISTAGHLLTTSVIGAVTLPAGGVVSTASVSGSDVAGVVTLTTTGTVGFGAATITFGTPYSITPPIVILTPSNFAAVASIVAVYVTATTTDFTINLYEPSPGASTGAKFNYIVIH